ncbi:hypothetical protein VOLCADRAFT_90042 [Volvox carteri f. nagariensis]|uniref:Protein kinase domain-containing protein n=1 Tax=Volvox carteri f. nagariensis TaxID=3068 RepID=D8TTC2_VOLCA|nr:uncharacterized protein VOLCADRAFT_90042 [Volvox carteri f. nagariensis]EFJ49174.1 hypothetical protein VOLCADRAFT_90042 [Volvox carteri f. nagariensis]|eukprot:XP_002949622.1 hypothetical protein VOLCADRAFT_90042 [Volvox carteri f. nagariensis]
MSIVFNASWVKILNPIGEGAFSRVYEGIYTNPDTLEESVVAVKILKKNMLKRRNIVACYGIGKYDDEDDQNPGSLFIVQELVRGGNLLHKVYKQMLNRHKCVYTSAEALEWLCDVAAGMQYLHSTSDIKPMIIHRDLKLENIMLMPDEGPTGTVAKLVDFGLHKVIDDRIKKVVKRVMSEANMGGMLARRHMQQQAAEGEIGEEEDELEAALAQQRREQAAMMMATAAGHGGAAAAAAAAANSGGGAGGGGGSPSGAAGGDAGSASAMPAVSEDGEEEEAVEGPAAGAGTGVAGGAAAGQGEARNGSFSRSPLGRPAQPAIPEDGTAVDVTEDPVRRLRAPPKKQNSMQKLMAKMKEIKLRVTGKLPADGTSAAEGMAPGGAATAASAAATAGAAGATAAKPAAAGVGGAGEEAAGGGGDLSAEAREKQVKMAQNEALLNKLIQQQNSTMAAAEKAQIMDDLGIVAGPAATERKRAPPRRAVTWVNEVRYNLTEAVGSWAYMAPEVVLGQPYNEKVDVFSFGVILFEVLNRKLMLVDEIKNDPRKDAQAYAERVARGFRPEIPRRWPDQLRELITLCWAQDPHLRPNFTAVVDMLEEVVNSGCVSKLDIMYWSRPGGFA